MSSPKAKRAKRRNSRVKKKPSQAATYKGKYWLFTINNPEENEEPPNIWPDVQYVVWQHEQGVEGTDHIQGYVVYTCKKTLQTIKNQCNERAHWEPRRGTHSEAKEYCMKTDSRVEGQGPWEHGTDVEVPDSAGERTDVIHIKRAIDKGASETAIATNEVFFPTWLRHFRGLERYRRLVMKPRTWVTHTTVYWGPMGSGKELRAFTEAGDDFYTLMRPGSDRVFFDGYDGQHTVVIDDFYGWIPRNLMYHLCDRYPMLVENKGGSTPFVSRRIIITSNDPPSKWWKKIGLGAMARRLMGDMGVVEFMRDDSWLRTPAGVAALRRGMPELPPGMPAVIDGIPQLAAASAPAANVSELGAPIRFDLRPSQALAAGGAQQATAALSGFVVLPVSGCWMCIANLPHFVSDCGRPFSLDPDNLRDLANRLSDDRVLAQRSEHYAFHATPERLVDDVDDIHGQPPLQSCIYCFAKVYEANSACETCSEAFFLN